jgi:hypothetical protein
VHSSSWEMRTLWLWWCACRTHNREPVSATAQGYPLSQ